jgi:hypothetical protein
MKNMQDSYFDQLIRTKLQSYEVPGGPSDWDALAERLDADFDAALAEKLATASVAYDPADWEAMDEMLALPLDALIKEKLENHEVPFEPADWEAMEASMPHPFDMAIQAKLAGLSFAAFDANWGEMGAQLDADFDADIRSQMDQIQPEPAPGDWDAMAALLYAEKPVAWYQRLAPVIDGALLLLIALLWWGVRGEAQTDILEKYEAQSNAPVIEQAEQSVSANSHIEDNTEIRLAEVAKEEVKSVPKQPNRPSSIQEAPAIGIPRDIRATSEKDDVLITARGTNQDFTQKGPYYRLTRIDYDAEWETLTISPVPVVFQEKKKRLHLPGLRIGATASLFTSAVEFNDKGMQGYLAGLRVELPLSEKLSIISGLQVGEKHFDRMKLNVSPGNALLNRQATYWVSRLQGNIQLLEIPVLLRYKFSTDKKVNLYFQGGFSPVISLNEEYLHYDPRSAGNLSQTQTRSDIDFTKAQDNPALEAYLNSLQPNRDVHNLNTYAGFLQVAPGVEVKLGAHLSFQAEPYIQLGLQRIGSERQSIHSLGGTFSLMYHFPNK